VVAAVVIALGLSPAREFVQRAVDRMLYGQRRDPYTALTELGRRLSGTIAPEDVLPVVVGTVARALRLPYVAITLAGEPVPAASHGDAVPTAVDVPLCHAGAEVGRLTIGLRDGQRHLDPGDRRLLYDLARHVGTAAHGVRLTHDLRRSRDRLAIAREEERNRIRRDLHDGLGPTLAGVALGIGAAGRAVGARAPETAELLADLQAEVSDGLEDVRRLVADLRPTTLEQVGLLAALRQYAETVSIRSDGSLLVLVEAPDRLPPLTAEAEVAAYRILLEALTNVTRHARANRCTVEIDATAGLLRLAVRDDGVGIEASPRRGGLGLRSMTQRAAELGGTCTVTAAPGGGTLVSATFPVARPT
jgi:signal transduction histidine kinase